MNEISLQQLNSLIRSTLEKGLAASYWIVAEISELNMATNGHCYLELVEKSENRIIAKNRATIWSKTYSNLSIWFERMTGQSLRPGMKILFNATIQYHEIFGLSLNIKDIDANYTIGERAMKRQKTINQLVEDGVFEMNKTLDLPLVTQQIAIISSKTAAGYGDFIRHLEENESNYVFKLHLFQATMQGETAARSIIESLYEINGHPNKFDVVAVIRGGGSQLDLDCFDDYDLNAHLAQFPIPVVTGIGHDRDETIADLVANTSLKTPTAVADFLIDSLQDFEEKIDSQIYQVGNMANGMLSEASQSLMQQLVRLAGKTQEKVAGNRHQLAILEERLKLNSTYFIKNSFQKVNDIFKHLELLSPLNVLKRGFTLTSLNNKLLKTTPEIGDTLVTETLTAKITSTVNKISKK